MEILREMGLTPVWRSRTPQSSASAADAAPAAAPAVPHCADPPRAMEAPASSFDAGAASAKPRAAVPRPAPAVVSDARRANILRMDWSELKACVAQCVACPLHQTRKQAVFGVGDEQADWLFIGEGPGAEEDARGEPFVGQAGRLLDSMLAAIGLKRGDNVYIANVVKCRPPGNRNPETAEALSCEPHLARQIALIQPRLIVALGKVAAQNLLASDGSIAGMRGRVHDYRGTPLIVTYHPAYLLRSLTEKAKAWADLCFARDTMARLAAASAR
jgi:DNA polymerase